MKYQVNFFVNEEPVELYVDANKTMLTVLREELDLTGAKEGCGAGECGACTVIMDGKPVNACLVLAPELDGKHITTVEGLADRKGNLSPLQEAFIKHAALQCGFCTPGFLLTGQEILNRGEDLTDEQLRKQLAGHLCRCTGYENIFRAVRRALDETLGK